MDLLKAAERFEKMAAKKSRFSIGKSNLHGIGAFASENIPKGTEFEIQDIPRNFRGFNWSCKPDLVGISDRTFDRLFAGRDIRKGEELTMMNPFGCDDRKCPNFRKDTRKMAAIDVEKLLDRAADIVVSGARCDTDRKSQLDNALLAHAERLMRDIEADYEGLPRALTLDEAKHVLAIAHIRIKEYRDLGDH